MLVFVAKRLMLLPFVLLGLLVVTFAMVRIGGSDPAAALAGDNATPEQIAEIRVSLGLDKPLPEQFLHYVVNAAQGDFGISTSSRRPVGADIADRLPATVELTLVALTIAAVLGIVLGTLAAVWRNSLFDHIVRVTSVIGLATASFWLAIMLQLLFSMKLGIFPLRDRLPIGMLPPPDITGLYTVDALLTGHWATFVAAISHLALPATTMALGGMATIARFTRSAVTASLQSDYAHYERAVGYPLRRVVAPYVLRNSLVTPVTQIGLLFGGFVSASVAIEFIFDWPGLGSYLVDAIFTSDAQAVLGVTLVIGVMYGIVNLLVDVAHGLLDPRIVTKG